MAKKNKEQMLSARFELSIRPQKLVVIDELEEIILTDTHTGKSTDILDRVIRGNLKFDNLEELFEK